MACQPAGEHRAYQPRAPEQGVLYTIVREHLETFLREAAERAEGAGLPHFVEQEFRDFLTCGVLAHGFARVRCGTCAFER
ncbi:MAG: IS91 family transposase, partial [Candidatus Rokubacteria bacterium]|nr:IS91 family transposase [Candidatus Rokubacteria bacterium]